MITGMDSLKLTLQSQLNYKDQGISSITAINGQLTNMNEMKHLSKDFVLQVSPLLFSEHTTKKSKSYIYRKVFPSQYLFNLELNVICIYIYIF